MHPFHNRGGRGNPNSNRGGKAIVQHGKQKLIASPISQSSSGKGNTQTSDEKLFQEFLKFKNQMAGQASENLNTEKGEGSNRPSYSDITSNIATDAENEDSLASFDVKEKKDIIIILDFKDVHWAFEPWKIVQRYLSTASYAAGSYKQRTYFESLLIATGTCVFEHFYPSPNDKTFIQFSKMTIKQLIAIEEWGISPMQEKEFSQKGIQYTFKYTYWDYVEALSKVFLYENPRRRHSWFIKVCSDVYKHPIPNWFIQWWTSYGPTSQIIPEPFKDLFKTWSEESPILKKAENENQFIQGLAQIHFFIEFSIPWIWKWTPEVGYTPEGLPCLKRTYLTKFWPKMTQNDPKTGQYYSQPTIDLIHNTLEKYIEHNDQAHKAQKEKSDSDLFSLAAQKIQMKKGKLSKSQLIKEYLELMEKDLKRNLADDEDTDDIQSESSSTKSMATSKAGDNQFSCLAGEAQNPDDNPAPNSQEVDEIFKKLKENY